MNCPACGDTNPDDAVFCGSCGNPLVAEAPCPRCGRTNPRDLKFCRGCGVRLGEIAATTERRAVSLPSGFGSGRYRIQRFLGEGGRKRVFLARDETLDRDVAIAVIKTEGLDESGMTRVKREAQAMARLGDHPNIVTVFDFGEQDGATFLVCQYMGGGSVEDLLKGADGRGLGIDRSIEIATQVARALEHAHDLGIVHRDVKPGNVWLGDDGTAKLGDFGLAVAIDRSRLTAEGMMLGTVAYMAPEQALGRQPDRRSDLYSLGAMLYETVTGRPPFLGDEAVAIISQHIGTAPVAPSWHTPDVPPALEKLVLGLLAKDPDQRPANAGAVVEALGQIAAGTAAVSTIQDRANPLDRLAGGVFVGREREMDDLRAGLDDSLSGHGRLVLLVGEPGIGKTRMTEELATWAKMRGAQVLVGRCYEGEGAPAYWPWVQVIRSYIHDRDADSIVSVMGTQGAAEIAQIASEIRERIPGLEEPAELDPEQARFRLFDSIATFLRNGAKAQPLVVVLDDLHWADKPSLLLLQFLAREMRSSRLLILGTYRDVELRRAHPLAQALAELNREQVSSRVALRGLTEPDVARYIEMTSGMEPPHELVAAVHRETEGNPFFVAECVRLLVSEGRLEKPAGGSWSISVPQSVREVVGRRLDQLSESSNALLQIASVVGREFALGVVQAVSDLDPDAVTDAIEEAVAARVVGEAPRTRDRYAFSHALIRETLYEEIPTTRRVGVHRRIGVVLETLYKDAPEPHLAELAYHFLEASPGGDVGKAVDYAERAAERALSQLAYEEATKHYRMALEALELAPGDPARRGRLLLQLGEANRRAGDVESARAAFFDAAELARSARDSRLLAQAGIGLRAGAGFGYVDERRAAILDEALGSIGNDDPALRSRLCGELARTLYFGDQIRVRALADESVSAAETSGDPAALAEALSTRAYVLWSADPPEGRLEAGDRIVRLANGIGETELLLDGLMWRIIALTEMPDIGRANAAVDDYTRVAEASRIPRYLLYALSRKATMAAIAGRFEEFDRYSREAYEIGRRAQEPDAIQVYNSQLLLPAIQRGDREKLREFLDNLASYVPRYSQRASWFPLMSAFAHLALGDREAAGRAFDEATADGLEAMWRQGIVVNLMFAMLAQLCVELERYEFVDRIEQALAPLEHRNIIGGGAVNSFGAGAYYLGLLHAAAGKLDDAVERFASANRIHARMGAQPFLAQSLTELADVRIRRRGPGDFEQASRDLDRALEIARELGMTPLAERALALRFEARGAAIPTDVYSSIDRVERAVEREQPDLRSHAAPDGTVTLLFSDIEGSTAMTERLGDRRWIEVLRTHNAIVREQVKAQGGYEVKSQGDGFMLAFSSARRALTCAIEIQRALAAHAEKNPDDAVRVRIGLHTGEAIADAGDFYGRHVNLAARVGAAAAGGEILVSSLLRELTESSGDFTFDEGRDVQLKGIGGTHRVYAVMW